MKNPLIKRLPRELIGEFPKYIVIFLFMTLTIGFISGFLVAGNSMIIAYDESFEKYNIDDGHVEFEEEADDTMMDEVEKEENVTFYKDFYKEAASVLKKDNSQGTMRVFKTREEVNKICLMEGTMPKKKNQVAIDRMHADNVGITRSVIVNALRKFESAGVIDCKSSGMKGTYIKVINEYVFDELTKYDE